MNDVNDAWERFLIQEYIIYWMSYYLNRIDFLLDNEV
jgi:hypothetical protein